MENRLKELQQGLAMDRTSCSRFAANQLRLLFSLAAYVLFQVLQGFARGAAVGPAQVWTLRERLLKVAVWTERSVRRIVLHFPQAFPWRDAWQDRKSTRLNSSHSQISYAVFCLKKKKKRNKRRWYDR